MKLSIRTKEQLAKNEMAFLKRVVVVSYDRLPDTDNNVKHRKMVERVHGLPDTATLQEITDALGEYDSGIRNVCDGCGEDLPELIVIEPINGDDYESLYCCRDCLNRAARFGR